VSSTRPMLLGFPSEAVTRQPSSCIDNLEERDTYATAIGTIDMRVNATLNIINQYHITMRTGTGVPQKIEPYSS
jgi:hypothetical protein